MTRKRRRSKIAALAQPHGAEEIVDTALASAPDPELLDVALASAPPEEAPEPPRISYASKAAPAEEQEHFKRRSKPLVPTVAPLNWLDELQKHNPL